MKISKTRRNQPQQSNANKIVPNFELLQIGSQNNIKKGRNFDCRKEEKTGRLYAQ